MAEIQWSKLSANDRLTLAVLALSGGFCQLNYLQERVLTLANPRPRPVPSQASLMRLSAQFPEWVESRGQALTATPALRRLALCTIDARELAAAWYGQHSFDGAVYWRGYTDQIGIVVCWLLLGAPQQAVTRFSARPDESTLYRALEWLLPPDHAPELLDQLPSSIQRPWIFRRFATAFLNAQIDLPIWRRRIAALAPVDQNFLRALAPAIDDQLLAGVPAKPSEPCAAWLTDAANGVHRCLGHADAAELASFEAAIKALRKDAIGYLALPGLSGILHWLLLIADQRPASLRRMRSLSKLDPSKVMPADIPRHQRMASLARVWLDGDQVSMELSADDPIGCWLELVLGWWRGVCPTEAQLAIASRARQRAAELGWSTLVDQLQACIDRIGGKAGLKRAFLIDLRQTESEWERTLGALEDLAKQSVARQASSQSATLKVIVAPLEYYEDEQFGVSLISIPQLRSGKSGRGKQLKSVRGINTALANWPNDSQEAAILRAALLDANARSWEPIDEAAGYPDSRTLKALIGYGEIYDDENRQLELREGRPRLTISGQDSAGLRLSLDPPFDPAVPVSWTREGDVWSRFEPNAQQKLLRGLLDRPQQLPSSAMHRLTEVAQSLQPWVELSLEADSGAAQVPPQSAPHLLLEWHEGSLLLQVRVRPLGKVHGPYCVPGIGTAQVLGSIGAVPTVTTRDLATERSASAVLIEQLGLSTEMAGEVEPEHLLSAEAALQFLAKLEQLEPLPIVAWPKGGAKRVLRGTQLNLQVQSGRDWIGVDGDLSLADGSLLAVKQLLGLIRAGESRFVTLDTERLLLLDVKLRAQLTALAPLADGRGQVKLNKLAAPALASALGEAEQAQSSVLLAELGRRSQAFALAPAIPKTLQADLRDYQREGYVWLMRMAAWGAGACLADDMGLGKTVQSLGLLCARAKGGPTLIVAPTSVLGNWAAEADRFAPHLRIHRYEQCTEREALLGSLSKGDVLLLSYTLLALDSEKLASQRFHTVILDEAQAIKNAATQRAKAACALQADFRLALTGTPIENHLGELWSLMNFLNPGLLGSATSFTERYAGPIERNRENAPAVRAMLRQLIGGFVLRRTKAQVLTELPERTEITVRIEPGAEEAKLQRAMRMEAIERLEQASDSAPGARRFSILAELMRLRRGACHPRLYAPELTLSGAKLNHLVELLLELRQNHHRALVFSQFVDYLSLVREQLDQNQISYQYLDGSTPSKRRGDIVAAFQDGESDCFLLSLKAGGSGLNLTAADYVIHLDPWWNPAVEQQASDRAHRIGQTRPVTVYRLILADSIEERILAMHGAKRELIDSVLAESDGGGAISEADLLALIAPDGG